MLNVIMLSVIMLSVIILSVVAPLFLPFSNIRPNFRTFQNVPGQCRFDYCHQKRRVVISVVVYDVKRRRSMLIGRNFLSLRRINPGNPF
jgi:hypothetical protein